MLCTQYSGKSASAWITQYTKEDIRHLLCHTTMSVKEIAFKLGFPNLSFFGSSVRRNFGMSPLKLRAQKG
jgi:AraC-like DNA-binding protein